MPARWWTSTGEAANHHLRRKLVRELAVKIALNYVHAETDTGLAAKMTRRLTHAYRSPFNFFLPFFLAKKILWSLCPVVLYQGLRFRGVLTVSGENKEAAVLHLVQAYAQRDFSTAVYPSHWFRVLPMETLALS